MMKEAMSLIRDSFFRVWAWHSASEVLSGGAGAILCRSLRVNTGGGANANECGSLSVGLTVSSGLPWT